MKQLFKCLLTLIAGFSMISPSLALSELDGRYTQTIKFKMGSMTVCPKTLPIEIELEVKDGIVDGYLFNNGGGNNHKFCKLYHNGSIRGEIDDDGKLIGVKIKQNDAHAKQYSSYKIIGNINGDLRLISRNSQYHPQHKFTLTKRVETANTTEETITTTTETVTVTNNSTAGQSSQNASSSNNNANTTSQSTQSTQVASAAASGTTVTTSTETVTSHSRWRTAATPAEAQAYVDELQASIVMFIAISEVIEQQPASLRDRVLNTVVSEIDRLRAEKALLQQQLTSRFSTPIRPNNANLSVSAFRAADTFPKIPFYVPGTSEIGEMLVVPRITDDGFLIYQFDFLDPTASYDKVRDTISIEHENIDLVITGLHKVDEWTLVAQENNVTRRIEKTSACIPEGKCKNKVQGVSSTEVVFQVYEDGSTAGRIQRNKGRFSTGYNMSVESSILLSAYLTYMRDVGSKEFNIGVMTDDEVKDLFN